MPDGFTRTLEDIGNVFRIVSVVPDQLPRQPEYFAPLHDCEYGVCPEKCLPVQSGTQPILVRRSARSEKWFVIGSVFDYTVRLSFVFGLTQRLEPSSDQVLHSEPRVKGVLHIRECLATPTEFQSSRRIRIRSVVAVTRAPASRSGSWWARTTSITCTWCSGVIAANRSNGGGALPLRNIHSPKSLSPVINTRPVARALSITASAPGSPEKISGTHSTSCPWLSRDLQARDETQLSIRTRTR